MDEEGVKLWIENVWNKRHGELHKENSLLVWDRFSPHSTKDIKKCLNHLNTKQAVIPGGLTSILQPLDVRINKPFQENVRAEWNKWMVEGDKSYTKGGNILTPPLDALCEFVVKSRDAIRVEVITKSFKKCGISNKMDGEEDDTLWRCSDGEDSNNEHKDEASDSELDHYDDLHLSASHELDFEGF
ncbi:Pogo transposable element-like 13 [Homarus americanus]|uniref:Pogo transposable element-like 13 n=1 Tax=Homarus americanus TaxID=6706 RepID=A0A8J5JXE4_HOMAM|nr:Pogo transposable element-like 13 [Homarus americanus]